VKIFFYYNSTECVSSSSRIIFRCIGMILEKKYKKKVVENKKGDLCYFYFLSKS